MTLPASPAVEAVEARAGELIATQPLDEFESYAAEAKKNHERRLARYGEKSIVDDGDTLSSRDEGLLVGPPAPPTHPNDLVPYKPSIFGLEKARWDCRLEMDKIVNEVSQLVIDSTGTMTGFFLALRPTPSHVIRTSQVTPRVGSSISVLDCSVCSSRYV